MELDQWSITPGDSLTAFMEQSVSTCDFVLVVCTPNYATKSMHRSGGVGYEQQIISGQIAAGIDRRKFIPVVREGDFGAGPGNAIPAHFQGIFAIDMRGPTAIDDQLEGLLRAIYRVPAVTRPALGTPPVFALPSGARLSPSRAVRLPSIELDGWQLISGVAMNEKHPSTFFVPEAHERATVKPTDFIKLNFEAAISDPYGEDESEGEGESGVEIINERMWVKVMGEYGPYLWGTLSNDPTFDGSKIGLEFGSEVIFLPEHIIGIMSAEDLALAETSGPPQE